MTINKTAGVPSHAFDAVHRFSAVGLRLTGKPKRGAATRYLREHLVHLAAIRYLQRERRCSLDTIRRRLAPLPAADLERLAAAA